MLRALSITDHDVEDSTAPDSRVTPQMLARAMEQSPSLVVITGVDGLIQYVNPAVLKLTGYTREELIGESPRILKSGSTAPETYDALWATLEAGGEWRGEFENKKKDGSTYQVAASISPIRDEGNRVTHYLAVEEDVTEKKSLEEQLFQSQKMQAVGTLAGGIAHDFNNILTVILGHVEFIDGSVPPGSDIAMDAETIRKAAEKASALTKQLLAFSRKQVLQLQVMNLNSVVRDVEKMLRRLIGEDIDLNVDLPEGLGNVKADPDQMSQVLFNLAVNARDAMPLGGRLSLSTLNQTIDFEDAGKLLDMEPGDYVRLTVSDTGTGMDSSTVARACEPFFSTKGRGKGTGLGLSTVQGIVKQCGGEIRIYSEPGEGTSVKVFLPRVQEEACSPSRQAESGPVPGGSETILIVEDDFDLRELASRSLHQLGYVVLKARHGDEALFVCEHVETEIHLIVTDVVMPELSGPALAEKLRVIRPELLVLFVSGYTDDAVGRHMIFNQNTPFLEKPFTLETLARTVRRVLDSAKP